jgi:abortive infection bacteriophage resistance protein
MQSDTKSHVFNPASYFENVIDRYNFDRHLRLILFDAIERIEIALRTKLIYHLSQTYGGLWYLNTDLVNDKNLHSNLLLELKKEFIRSQEIFAREYKRKYGNADPDAWIIFEVASLGTLSKFYKNISHQLPEKSKIANEMGLNLHTELSSWLEAITYVRNIIAHHSRLWSRNMVRKPMKITNPGNVWVKNIIPVQEKKPYLIISAMVYLCNAVSPNHHIKSKILELIDNSPKVPIYKGFLNNWQNESLWER